jgi:hypothetical protein
VGADASIDGGIELPDGDRAGQGGLPLAETLVL